LGPSAAEAGRTAETQAARQDRTAGSGAAGSPDGDRVELSTTLGQLSQAIATQGVQRSQKVQALAADYQAGRYQPNAAGISRALVAQALGADSQ